MSYTPFPGGPFPPGQFPPGQFPPGQFPPPPPRKGRAGLAAAALVGAVAVGAGVVTAVHHLTDARTVASETSTTSPLPSASKSGTASPSGGAGERIPIPLPQEREYLKLINRSGITVTNPSLMIRDGHEACSVLGRSGSVPEAAMASSKGYPDPDLRDLYGLLTTVTAVEVLCPQNSPFTPDPAISSEPLPEGQDREFILRLRGVGMSVSSTADAVADAGKVCSITRRATEQSLSDAAHAVKDANPRMSLTASTFFAVIAIQVYCPVAQ